MQSIKFLADGRKVAVVGQLNANETIVQEVYVADDGSEIPAGHNFVVKSVLDSPLKTWKESQAEKYEAHLAKAKAEWESLSAQLAKYQGQAQEKMKQLKAFASNAAVEHLETLEAYLAGDINYMVLHRYDNVEVRACAQVGESSDSYDPGFRLLSLFGCSNGDLRYRINRYKDDSGTWDEVDLCRNMAEVTEKCQAAYDSVVAGWRNGTKKYPPRIDFAKGAEIQHDRDVVEYWDKRKAQKRADEIESLKAKLAKLEAEVQ